VLVDQFAQGDRLNLRSNRVADTLRHGGFLRWPPAKGGLLVVHPYQPEECAIFFHTTGDTTSDSGI
jgi:hypothetical protein